MPEAESKPTRRTLLRTAPLALITGIAGCTSISGSNKKSSQSDQTPTPSSATTTQPTKEGSTPTQSTQTPTQTTTETTSGGSLSFPFMNPMSGTTEYGIELQGSPVMGMKDAPIDMYYWSDYTCPWCQTFALKMQPKLAKNEVANGVLRIVFLELPYKTKNSWPASILAKCVWREVSKTDPNLYWKWHHAVFEAQKEPGSGWADIEKLFEITKNVGIDTKPIAKCIENRQKKIKADIEAEKEAANRTSVQGTPAFLLYNRQTGEKAKVAGAQPYSRFSAKIQSIQ